MSDADRTQPEQTASDGCYCGARSIDHCPGGDDHGRCHWGKRVNAIHATREELQEAHRQQEYWKAVDAADHGDSVEELQDV